MSLLIRMRGLIAFALMIAAGLGNETIASGLITLSEDGWHTWRVPSVEVPGEERIYVLMRSGEPAEIEVPGRWCNTPHDDEVIDLGLVSTDESIDWLQQYKISRSDLGSDALAAISRHAGDRSLNVLIGIVESDSDHELREEAVFWMVLSESDAAFEYIDRLLIKN